MSITFKCPSCSKLLKAKKEHIGRQAKCPKHGASLTAAVEPPPIQPITSRAEEIAPQIDVHHDVRLPSQRRRQSSFSLTVFLAATIPSIALGYFIGREHLKYEMRSAMSKAVERMMEGVGEAFGNDPEKDEEFREQTPAPMGVTIVDQEFSVGVSEARISRVELESKSTDTEGYSDDEYLILTLVVKNTHDRKILRFAENLFISHFRLYDDVNNQIRGINFGFMTKLTGAIDGNADILPGRVQRHVLVFNIPPPKTQYLILDVDKAAFYGEGRLKYQIPVDRIKRGL